ncbi:hypothetical protein STENM327S_00746 [Streptomyces tendae]
MRRAPGSSGECTAAAPAASGPTCSRRARSASSGVQYSAAYACPAPIRSNSGTVQIHPAPRAVTVVYGGMPRARMSAGASSVTRES